MNVSSITITFTIYRSLEAYNSILVVCILVLYLSCLCLNMVLVLVIYVTPELHRPMHLLLVNLALSSMVGISLISCLILHQVLVTQHRTSLLGCLTQIFFINVYGTCVFGTLALMALDRYVFICRPLHYHSIVTLARVKVGLLLMYLVLGFCSAINVYLTSRLRLCRFTVNKLMCDSVVVTSMSCNKSKLATVFGLCIAICLVLLPCMLVVLSYINILLVVLKTSPESRKKALNTCMPHIITFVNFTVASFSGLIYSRVSNHVPHLAHVLTAVNYFVLPALLHPVVYGIKTQEIRQSLSRMLVLLNARMKS